MWFNVAFGFRNVCLGVICFCMSRHSLLKCYLHCRTLRTTNFDFVLKCVSNCWYDCLIVNAVVLFRSSKGVKPDEKSSERRAKRNKKKKADAKKRRQRRKAKSASKKAAAGGGRSPMTGSAEVPKPEFCLVVMRRDRCGWEVCSFPARRYLRDFQIGFYFRLLVCFV